MTSNSRAIGLMVFAMAALATTDAVIKILVQTLPPPQVMSIIGLVAALGFCVMARRQNVSLAAPTFFAPMVMARNCAEGFAALCMFWALALTPLSTLTAIIQAVPILVTLGAVFILREQVGLYRWIAVCMGLLGVLVILRPGGMNFEAGMALSFGAALGLAARDVFTRAAPVSVHVSQLATWGIAFTLPVAFIWWALSGEAHLPTAKETLLLAFSAVSVMAGYWAVTTSVRLAEVSIVVPFRYCRLPFGVALGIILFDEQLDRATIIGAAIIVAAGLYIMHRERISTLTPRQ